jgi:hypothetical protein
MRVPRKKKKENEVHDDWVRRLRGKVMPRGLSLGREFLEAKIII